jgi:hypothetical protein
MNLRHNMKNASNIDFDQPQPGIQIDEDEVIWEGPNHESGTFTISGRDKYICYRLTDSISGKKNLEIYRDIQYGAYVQRYYGIAKIKTDYYAVMEALVEGQNLYTMCSQQSMPHTLQSRLKIAYNIAKTMAWYHRADLLLKSLQDYSVVLQASSNGEFVPYITHVETIRHVKYVFRIL